ncbi:MAG: Ig-like domain repeat protein [Geobacteraceae bacterium]|nr:Ig-like domain repeat protein [Geobacteraceae bacterium]
MKTIKLITFAISLLFLPTLVYAVNLGDIVTIAGGGVGDNGIATSQCIKRPTGVTVDSSGNLYIASDNRIRKVASGTGIITTVAGNGIYGYSGDNGLAILASFKNTYSVTVDSSGNLYIADQDNNRIRKVDYRTGIITTVASVNSPAGITVDSSGNLYIADGSNNRIRKVDRGTGLITTVAGNGTQGFSGDNGAATAASLNLPNAVAVDSSNNLYIVDRGNYRIRKVDHVTGIISTVAGNSTKGFSGDNGTAASASLNNPYGVTIDSNGNLYFGDLNTSRIRKVDSGTGIITTVAGNGTQGYSGDNGAATAASFDWPRDVTVDSSGNLYIADYINNRIRKVDSGTGIITTVAGNGTEAYAGDNGPATSASFDNLRGGVTVDSTGNFYIADYNNNRIRKVTRGTGIITTVAGNGTGAYAGDNGPATSASLYSPSRVAIDSSGNLFIADTTNHRIRKVAIGTGIITTVAGSSSIGGFGGDNGPATSARLYWPSGVTFDSNGNLYIADYGNHRIRKVASGTGIITTVAGNGSAGFSGDGGAAIAASLHRPSEVIVDSSDNLYFAEYYNQRIRKVVNGTGIITTVAGNGTQGFSGDNVAATSASLNNPWGVAIDSSGNLYIADKWNHRIRKVDRGTGIITTVAGNGSYGFSGDNGPATSANVYDPTGVTLDSSGNLYITEWGTGRIRKVYLYRIPTVAALVSSAAGNSSVIGDTVTFTATVTSTEVIPTNTTVTFKDGAATIGSGALDATGTATFTTSSLSLGSHNITASYPDNGILSGSTSPILVQTVIASPTSSNLSMTLLGAGGGSVNSSPTGIACVSGSSSGCVQAFPNGTPITLTATPDWKSSFTGWGPPCNGTDTCLINLNGDAGVSATFSVVPRIKLPGPNFFASLQDAYEQANDGDTLNTIVYSFSESLQIDRSITVTLRGGMSSDFLNQDAYTTLEGSLTVVQGTLVVDHLVVK